MGGLGRDLEDVSLDTVKMFHDDAAESRISPLIITRTPLRITLGGGGTDLPSYYERFGGFVLSAAVNRYIYIVINRTFSDEYLIKYSELERTNDVDLIEHPIVREALRLHPMERGIELVSVADIPAGTGLGSSGAFTVGVLRAIYAYKREHVTAANLARGGVRDRDRTAGAPGRQAGSIHCRLRRPDVHVLRARWASQCVADSGVERDAPEP